MPNQAPGCQHIKTSGTRCGSPALKHNQFCYYHQHCRSVIIDFRAGHHDYSPSDVILPAFDDAHSIQLTLRQVTELILLRKMDDKTAGLLLYALQIASSNLKRLEREKPQPEQVVTDPETESESQTPMAALNADEDNKEDQKNAPSDEDLPFGTIQACYRPGPLAVVRVARPLTPTNLDSGRRIRQHG